MRVELRTTDVAHGGYCVGRHDGVVVFVTGALPGEKVVVEVTDQRSRLWFGRVVEVLEASPDRVDHVWGLAERAGVGGVDLGHVSLDAGRHWKARVIETQLARLAHVNRQVTVEAAPGDEDRHGLAWRTRVTFQIDDQGRLGMYAAKSHQIVPIDGMPLAHEDIQAELARVIQAGGMPEAAGGSVTYVRASGSGLTVMVDPPSRSSQVAGGGKRASGTGPSRLGRRGSGAGDRVKGEFCARGAGGLSSSSRPVKEVVVTRFGTWTYDVAADGFWQVHREAPQVLVSAVMEAVEQTSGPIWDLYAGAGLFTVPLAASTTGTVTAVESAPAGVAWLKRNTAAYDVHCVSGDVTRALSWAEPTPHGVIVCDPPRNGAGRQAVAQMARLGLDRIVYVACDPAAFARDVNLFAAFNYELAALRAFDLFPLTHHVECVGQLVRR
ncbi:MAG: TRAM domain-containing protein [Propionibacteriaceae bacterium]|jgi:tRNA/tmRNA/rRNA uracil-C5-methylase (TrmA/RlmC/RlmD family)|nr:TRAM domain-containing protein [Propionibacteriaceae bacterium]